MSGVLRRDWSEAELEVEREEVKEREIKGGGKRKTTNSRS